NIHSTIAILSLCSVNMLQQMPEPAVCIRRQGTGKTTSMCQNATALMRFALSMKKECALKKHQVLKECCTMTRTKPGQENRKRSVPSGSWGIVTKPCQLTDA